MFCLKTCKFTVQLVISSNFLIIQSLTVNMESSSISIFFIYTSPLLSYFFHVSASNVTMAFMRLKGKPSTFLPGVLNLLLS